ncbi:MAG TPA: hypothetical protein VHM64_11290 [Candidatus Binatia bacterium]|nr:hypothetical protein [Candidatus Binatia bacterium]
MRAILGERRELAAEFVRSNVDVIVSLTISIGIAIFDNDVFAFDVAEAAKRCSKCLDAIGIHGGG